MSGKGSNDGRPPHAYARKSMIREVYIEPHLGGTSRRSSPGATNMGIVRRRLLSGSGESEKKKLLGG